MKKIFAAAAATILSLGFATAASAADFTGPRAAIVVGTDSIEGLKDIRTAKDLKAIDGLTYGVQAGVDTALTKNTIVGIAVEATETDGKLGRFKGDRDYSVVARLGYKVASPLLVYVSGGYTNQRLKGGNAATNLDGVRYGGGVELAVIGGLYVGAEYRHSDYQNRFRSDKGQASVGVRF